MTLSNTATPKYYGEFRDKVIAGIIPISKEVGLQMALIDDLIANPNFYYDSEAIDGFIAFCEGEMTLTDGSDLIVLDSFKLWAEDLLAWFYFEEKTVFERHPDGPGGHFVKKVVKKRLRKKQYLIVARGAAKSMYVELLQAYMLVVDTSTTHQITTAPTMKQADEVMAPFRTAIARAKGPLFKFLTEGSLQNTTGSKSARAKLVSTKKGIENLLTNSVLEVRPMTKDKLQSLRPKVASVDEWLSGDVREDVVGALEQGASKHEEYIILAVSSEGTVRNGSGDTIKIELMKILNSEYFAPWISTWWYKLDDVKEVGIPELWPKAQPNIDITVSYEAYHQDVIRAENNPATRNDILAKRFGLPMEGYTYFFTYEETQVHPRRDFWRMACSMGADLSQGDDFCAFTFLFPLPNGDFGVKTRSYITEHTMMKLPAAMQIKYQEFLDEGSLHVMPGVVLDMDEIYEDLEKFIEEQQYDVRSFGYDPYNAKGFVGRYETEHGSWGVEKVPQGARTESVPLGDIKHLTEHGGLIFDQKLMSFAMGNAVTTEDTNGNRKLFKMRKEQKIDNVAALVDAWVAYKLHTEDFE